MLEVNVIKKPRNKTEVKAGDIIWNRVFNTYYLVSTVSSTEDGYQLIRLDGRTFYGGKMTLNQINEMIYEDEGEFYKVENVKLSLTGEVYK